MIESAAALKVTAASVIRKLATVDALVVEANLSNCDLAYELASAGCSTALVASGFSLPHDWAIARRAWVDDASLSQLSTPFRNIFEKSIEQHTPRWEAILNLARLAQGMEDILLDAGVQLIYGLKPVDTTLTSDQCIHSVIFGGKGGLQSIACRSVIDGTHLASIARMAGCKHQNSGAENERVIVRFAAKLNMFAPGTNADNHSMVGHNSPAEWPPQEDLILPQIPGLVNDRVTVHGPFAEIAFETQLDASNPLMESHLSQ